MRVIVDRTAQRQIDEAFTWWSENRSVEQADRWARGLEFRLGGLVTNPRLHSLAPEDEFFPCEVRQLLHGLGRRPTHRALFTIHGDIVYVFAVRHVARQLVEFDDVELPDVLGDGTVEPDIDEP